MEPAHATTKASRSRCMDVIHIWNPAHATTKASRSQLHGFNSYMEPAHATTKASRSRCMDLIHIWNLLMLQLKRQEIVAWI